MAQEKDTAVTSDTEGQEKPVREQLKKASIAPVPQDAQTSEVTTSAEEAEGQRGRAVSKKRSFEELQADAGKVSATEAARHHSRKRSRGSSAEEDELNNGQRKSGERPRQGSKDAEFATENSNGEEETTEVDRPNTPEQRGDKRAEAAVEGMTSPKTKRSRLHSTNADENGIPDPKSSDKVEPPVDHENATEVTETQEVVKPKDQPAKVPAGSGFGNTSAVSPFGALAGSKSPSTDATQASASAFAGSAFGALAGSSTSGFGAIGKSTGGFGSGGSFATGTKTTTLSETPQDVKADTSASSTFGGALGQKSAFSSGGNAASSGFGSGSSGFASLSSGGGFGSTLGGSGFGALGGGGGLTTFGSGKPSLSSFSSTKPPKTFGAPADDEDESNEQDDGGDDADSSGIKSPLSTESDKKDERFYARELETGEEDEKTHYSCRAKLYTFATLEDGKKEWKERGLGTVRLNVKKALEGADDQAPKARLLMRAEGSHRVVLNTPVKKEIPFGAPSGGGPPQGGYLFFQGTIDGKTSLQLLQLKIRQQFATELYEHIEGLKEQM